jgi:hypothetical protein
MALPPAWDLLLCAKYLFFAARRSSSQRSLTGHLDRGFDGIFKIVRVVGRGLVSFAEVHAIIARAHAAQSEPEMARDRLGFLERHHLPFAFRRDTGPSDAGLNGSPGWIARVAWRYEARPRLI